MTADSCFSTFSSLGLAWSFPSKGAFEEYFILSPIIIGCVVFVSDLAPLLIVIFSYTYLIFNDCHYYCSTPQDTPYAGVSESP